MGRASSAHSLTPFTPFGGGETPEYSDRIADLYPHPARPVADLTIKLENGFPVLEFSADEARTYAIEASGDLANWQEVGVPSPDETGLFSFVDLNAGSLAPRFYRVMTR